MVDCNLVGSVYMAPEVISGSKYDERADVYSFGVVMVEVFTGNAPYSEPEFRDMMNHQLMYKILHEGLRPSLAGVPEEFALLVGDCWNEDPASRPDFTEILLRLRRLKHMKISPVVARDNLNDDNYEGIVRLRRTKMYVRN